MFNFFKKKSPLERLEATYKKLLEESYTLSSVNRRESDAKQAEANEVLKQIEQLKNE